jgi:hypothetical protein
VGLVVSMWPVGLIGSLARHSERHFGVRSDSLLQYLRRLTPYNGAPELKSPRTPGLNLQETANPDNKPPGYWALCLVDNHGCAELGGVGGVWSGPIEKCDPLRIEYSARILDFQASFCSHSVFARKRYCTYLKYFQGRMVVKRGPRVDLGRPLNRNPFTGSPIGF